MDKWSTLAIRQEAMFDGHQILHIPINIPSLVWRNGDGSIYNISGCFLAAAPKVEGKRNTEIYSIGISWKKMCFYLQENYGFKAHLFSLKTVLQGRIKLTWCVQMWKPDCNVYLFMFFFSYFYWIWVFSSSFQSALSHVLLHSYQNLWSKYNMLRTID